LQELQEELAKNKKDLEDAKDELSTLKANLTVAEEKNKKLDKSLKDEKGNRKVDPSKAFLHFRSYSLTGPARSCRCPRGGDLGEHQGDRDRPQPG